MGGKDQEPVITKTRFRIFAFFFLSLRYAQYISYGWVKRLAMCGARGQVDR